jgi:hypothetical protein
VEIWPWLVGAVAAMIVPEIALRRLGPGAFSWIRRLGRRRRDASPEDREEARR